MFRALKRLVAGSETRQLARDVDVALDEVEYYRDRLVALSKRIERHVKTLDMRETRAARLRPDFDPELEALRERALQNGSRDPDDDFFNGRT